METPGTDQPQSGQGSVSHTDRCEVLHGHETTSVLFFPAVCQFSLILSFLPQDSDMLACHNYWHWALYLIEKVR